MKKAVNGLFIGLGFLFLGLGAVGVALPLLPTTPFLILSTLCFAKGSEKFHHWFMGTGLYLKYVEPTKNKKGMDTATKKRIILPLAVIFSVSIIWVPFWHAKAVIALVALFHFYYFLFRIKTIPKEVDTEKKRMEEYH